MLSMNIHRRYRLFNTGGCSSEMVIFISNKSCGIGMKGVAMILDGANRIPEL